MKWGLILLTSLFCKLSLAQFTFRYEYDSTKTFPSSFVEVEDGYVIAGNKAPNQSDNEPQLKDSYLVKINEKGVFQWSVELKDSLYNGITSIGYDGQNIFATEVSFVSPNKSKAYFLKFDKNGNLLLKKAIGTMPYTSRDNLPTNLVIKKNGTILVNNSEYNFTTGNTECVVYNLNKDGEIINRVGFSEVTRSCIPYDMVEVEENGFCIVMSALDLTLLQEEIFLLKFDEAGNESWRKLIQTEDPVQTDFSLCELNSSIYCAMSTTYTNGGLARLSLVKYDKNGNALLEANYANYSPPDLESFSTPKISLNQDSTGLLIFGSFASAQTTFSPTLLFTDLNGGVHKKVKVPYLHTIGNGWSVEMITTNDNGIALLNRNFSYLPQASEYTELVKLDCQGNFEWKDECSFINSESDVLIFPNPSYGEYTFQLQSLTENPKVQIEIYNNIGQLIFAKVPQSIFFTLDLSGVSNGVYHYKIFTDKSLFSTGKLIRL